VHVSLELLADADVIAINVAACHGSYHGQLSLAQVLTVLFSSS